MKKVFLLLGFLLTILATSEAQLDSILLADSKLIDIKKYSDHKNSPYYFEDWVVGSIIGSNQDMIDSVLLNYNGYTRAFEIKVADRYIKLNDRHIVRVIVDARRNKLDETLGRKVVFQKGIHPKYSKEFLTINYTGRNVFLLSQFITGIQKSEELNLVAGSLDESRKFTPKKLYFLLMDGELRKVKLKKKSVVKALSNSDKRYKKKLENYLKRKKNGLKTEQDLFSLLAYFDTIVE